MALGAHLCSLVKDNFHPLYNNGRDTHKVGGKVITLPGGAVKCPAPARRLKRLNSSVRISKAISAVLVMIVLVFNSLPAKACGPFLDRAIFACTLHPDMPLRKFAEGKLGILLPTYARSYLFVAYRYLAGLPLTQVEQSSILSLWHHRLYMWDDVAHGPGFERWLSERAQVPLVSRIDKIDQYRRVDRPSDQFYLEYLNCPDDAFENAASVLKERTEKYGLRSREIQEWVKAQDSVFCHCFAPRFNWDTKKEDPEPPFPQPASDSADNLIKADRAYQIAAAHFYAGQFDKARQEFLAIAHDATSPWCKMAPYLAARALIRKATVRNGMDKDALSQAEAELNKTIADGAAPQTVRDASAKLLTFVGFRLHPEETLKALAKAIVNPEKGKSLESSLSDYTLLLDNLLNGESSDRSTSSNTGSSVSESLPLNLRTDDITDWIYSLQNADKVTVDYALRKWDATHRLPWLIAAITHINTKNQNTERLIAAVEKLDRSSPGYLSAWYQVIRLLIDQGHKDEARRRLDKILTDKGLAISPSSRNLLLIQRRQLARNLGEFVKYAALSPAVVTDESCGVELPEECEKVETARDFLVYKPGLDEAMALMLNSKMPLAVLKEMAKSPILPADVRKDLVQAVWVRASLLNNPPIAAELSPILSIREPSFSQMINRVKLSHSKEEKQFALAYLILKAPGMRPYVTAGVGRRSAIGRIDSYGDNWWCAGRLPEDQSGLPSGEDIGNTSLQFPDFIDSHARRDAYEENKRLAALGSAPEVLARFVLVWAKLSPKDTRIPEALHLAVRATRYGCEGAHSSELSKQCFQLLHKVYPRSNWTKQTPYWY